MLHIVTIIVCVLIVYRVAFCDLRKLSGAWSVNPLPLTLSCGAFVKNRVHCDSTCRWDPFQGIWFPFFCNIPIDFAISPSLCFPCPAPVILSPCSSFFYLEDRGRRFLQNVGTYLVGYMVSYPRRQYIILNSLVATKNSEGNVGTCSMEICSGDFRLMSVDCRVRWSYFNQYWAQKYVWVFLKQNFTHSCMNKLKLIQDGVKPASGSAVTLSLTCQ
jgi:hypothetical protein